MDVENHPTYDFLKVPQDIASYDPLGGLGDSGEACANCLFFVAPDHCRVVEDHPYPIVPTGHSMYWTAIPDELLFGYDEDEEGDEEEEPSYAATVAANKIIRHVGGKYVLYSRDGSRKLGTYDTRAEAEAAERRHRRFRRPSYRSLISPATVSALIKAVWSTAYVNDLPDSSFAVVSAGGSKDEDGKTVPRSLRHLPFKDANGKVDLPHLRNALARLPQADLTTSERATARRKLEAAARAAGVGDRGDDKQRGVFAMPLFERFLSAMNATFRPTPPEYANRMTAAPATDSSPIADGAAAAQYGGGSLHVYKDLDDRWRWIAMVSNKYRDRDHPPEIIADAAHREYVAYLDMAGDADLYPEAWLWHTPGTKWGKADWADYADGFLLMSGTVDPGMEDTAANLAEMTLGVSHGFYQQYADKANGVIGWYRTFEVSALPPEVAANPWTTMAVIQKEVQDVALSAEKRVFLEQTLGKQRTDALEHEVEMLAKTMQAAGVEYKDVTATPTAMADPPVPTPDPEPEPTPEPAPEPVPQPEPAPVVSPAALLTMQEAVLPLAEAIRDLHATVSALKARLDAVEKTDDAKIAEAFAPRAGMGMGLVGSGYRATQAAETGLGANPNDPLNKQLEAARPLVDPGFLQSLR